MTDELLLKYESPLAILTLNRPQKLNALTDTMLDRLNSICREVEQRQDIRVLIITGAGDRAFCAGGDIAAWSELEPRTFASHWVRNGHSALDALAQLRQPVVAVLNGHTLGGGLELAATADYRIAESHIRIGQPETSLGIIPGWSGTQRTSRRFGTQLVRRMALFGDEFTAEEALSLGIVDRVVASQEGLNAARDLAEQLLTRSPQASDLAKMLINAVDGEDKERALEALAGQIAAASQDLQTGLDAFRNKRPAQYSAAQSANNNAKNNKE